MTSRLGDNIQIVGDDLLVTNTKFITRAIDEKACNAVLIKLKQIGTMTETVDARVSSPTAAFARVAIETSCVRSWPSVTTSCATIR